MRKQLIVAKILSMAISCMLLSACVGTVIGTAVDVAVEVVKVPFKVGGAVIDVVTGDDFAENADAEPKEQDPNATDMTNDRQAVQSEQVGL